MLPAQNAAPQTISSEETGIIHVLLLADIRHLEELVTADLTDIRQTVLKELATFARDLGNAIRHLGREHPLIMRLGMLIVAVQKLVL